MIEQKTNNDDEIFDFKKMSKEERMAYADAISRSTSPSASRPVTAPSVTGSLSQGVSSGVTAGLMTGSPHVGLAVGALTAIGSYKQASAEAEKQRREKIADLILENANRQAMYTQNIGKAYDDYSERMSRAIYGL